MAISEKWGLSTGGSDNSNNNNNNDDVPNKWKQHVTFETRMGQKYYIHLRIMQWSQYPSSSSSSSSSSITITTTTNDDNKNVTTGGDAFVGSDATHLATNGTNDTSNANTNSTLNDTSSHNLLNNTTDATNNNSPTIVNSNNNGQLRVRKVNPPRNYRCDDAIEIPWENQYTSNVPMLWPKVVGNLEYAPVLDPSKASLFDAVPIQRTPTSLARGNGQGISNQLSGLFYKLQGTDEIIQLSFCHNETLVAPRVSIFRVQQQQRPPGAGEKECDNLELLYTDTTSQVDIGRNGDPRAACYLQGGSSNDLLTSFFLKVYPICFASKIGETYYVHVGMGDSETVGLRATTISNTATFGMTMISDDAICLRDNSILYHSSSSEDGSTTITAENDNEVETMMLAMNTLLVICVLFFLILCCVLILLPIISCCYNRYHRNPNAVVWDDVASEDEQPEQEEQSH